jgi:hypothetical protein
VRIFLREWPFDGVSQNGLLGSEPARPVLMLHVRQGVNVDTKRKMLKKINAAVADAYQLPDFMIFIQGTGLDGGRRRLAGDDRFETQIVVMASDSDAVSWLRLGGRFVSGTHCVRGRTGSSRAFGFNTNWRMPVRPMASTWLSPVWTPATSNSTSRSTTNQALI